MKRALSPRRRTKLQTQPEFKIHSYIGTDIAQLREDGERPPKSAKLVANLDMGSGPGSGDFRIYLLSTNRERSLWILWLKAGDYLEHACCRVATGRPYRGLSAKFAAEQLLIKSWQDERDKEEWFPVDWLVMNAGLLNQEDISRIKLAVFGE